MDIVINTNPSEQDLEEIRLGIVEHNRPFLETMRDEPLACYIHHPQDNSTKIAGITGRIRGDWLLVNFLWVAPEFKRQGLGSQLLHAAEQHAASIGCHAVLLDTWSFQARPFYEKKGYTVEMEQESFMEGVHKYHMIKKLDARESQ